MTTETKTRREWSHMSRAPLSEYLTLRPDYTCIEGLPDTDSEGRKLVLPYLRITSIEILMPKLNDAPANYRVTDFSANEFVEHSAMLSYIREKLNGHTNPQGHLDQGDHVRIVTNSPEIIKLWSLHHCGEFAGHANAVYGSMPLKMKVDTAQLAQEQYQPGTPRELDFAYDNQAIAWSYINNWNYIVRKNGRLQGISIDDDQFEWINNIAANQYTEKLDEAEDDDC